MGNCPTRWRSNMAILENSPEEVASDQQDGVIVSLCNVPSFALDEQIVCIGEKLSVISDDGDFLMVRSTRSGLESYIPSQFTAKVTQRWLFKGISRCQAEELLMHPNNHSGAFLIRESESSREGFSLSVLRRANSSSLDCVKHYRVSQLQNGWVYISPRLTFPSLQHLVEHYSESTAGLCCPLTAPCFIKGLDNEVKPVPTAVRRPTINWKDITKSVILRRKRTESDHALVSEGLREAISSYLQMTEGDDGGWDT